MKVSNNKINWQPHYILDIFEFHKGNQNNMKSLTEGDMPLISARNVDNGFNRFVSPNKKKTFDGHCLTLNLDGDGGAGIAYYQPHTMCLDSHVGALVPKKKLSRQTLLFIAACITMQRNQFGHAHSINNGRISTFQFMLPTKKDQTPDYKYMDYFMKKIESELLLRYSEYVKDKGLPNTSSSLCADQWLPFNLEDLCDIYSGQDIYDSERTTGDTPYITSTASQNGIGYFVGNTNKTLERDCISVNRNGSVGYAFFHPYFALYGNDTRKLRPKHKSRYVGFFLAIAISQQRHKYGYGLKMGTQRLKSQAVLLPAKSPTEPDYAYMEQYMQAVENKLLQNYINTRINKTHCEHE